MDSVYVLFGIKDLGPYKVPELVGVFTTEKQADEFGLDCGHKIRRIEKRPINPRSTDQPYVVTLNERGEVIDAFLTANDYNTAGYEPEFYFHLPSGKLTFTGAKAYLWAKDEGAANAKAVDMFNKQLETVEGQRWLKRARKLWTLREIHDEMLISGGKVEYVHVEGENAYLHIPSKKLNIDLGDLVLAKYEE